ncbi:CopD family protein [Bradyrhizobium sp. dw_411]|uniref:copper resistance CopC/CopD family protein n=1 Tax=Bradyrhizobium sp. dw_411 TaxID=2720082 RepID=UPI001BD10A84|nr:CopD family protein [Bradyrhizobium sp. dw_411]
MRLLACLAVLLSVLCATTEASAHASLISTEPGDGSMMAQSPKSVRLRFNESVRPAAIKLIDGEGRVRDDAVVSAHDDTIEITLPDNLARGAQFISYRVFSADGHPVGGSLTFSLGMPAANVVAQTDGSFGLAPLIWLARIGVYLGLFVGVGGVFFGVWLARRDAGASMIGTALVVGLVSAVAALGLQGLDLLDLPSTGIVTSAPWKAAAATSLFSSLMIAIAAMIVAAIARRDIPASAARALSALAIVGVGLALATSGHASTAPPQWLSRPMVFLHGIGVAFWIGALAPLVAMARRPKASLLAILNRFSRMAVPVVGVLVLTGLVLAIVQLESFRALIETRYGLILLIKLALVLVLLGLAALNRFYLTPALALDPSNISPLVRSIMAECVVAVAILAVVAGWRFTPPPRALVTAIATPLAVHIHTETAMFQVLVSPGTVGTDSFVLQLMNGDASPLEAKETTLFLSLPERGIEALERKAVLGADGYWHVLDVPLPYAGRWHMRIDALITDFKKISLEDDLDVPGR